MNEQEARQIPQEVAEAAAAAPEMAPAPQAGQASGAEAAAAAAPAEPGPASQPAPAAPAEAPAAETAPGISQPEAAAAPPTKAAQPQAKAAPEARPARGGKQPPQEKGQRNSQQERNGRNERKGQREAGRQERRGGPEGPVEIDLDKLISDSLYLDNQAHAVVARMRDMDSGTRSQLRRLFSAVRRACRTEEAERQHAFVMLRARLAYTIARHQLRSLDPLEKLLLQVTRKNDPRGYERFRDLFEAIVAYNE
jgi:CRISPR type III-A-associated protein Csm2